MTVHWIPEGYPPVAPYLVVPDADKLVAFMGQVFGGQLVRRLTRPDGSLSHGEVKIGDSIIMVGEAQGDWPPMPAMLHIYVEAVDAVYDRALQAGATPIMPPADQVHGDRMAGVQDAHGNQWWIATRLEALADEEVQRRMDGQAASGASA